MDKQDKKEFAEMWRACWESCGKTVTDRQLHLEFATLEPYTVEQVKAGLTAHRRDPDAGQYPPKAADVIRNIDGGKPGVDQIIAAAMKPKTALAVLCRIEIGSWNLDNWDRFKLAPLAESCIAQIPEWKQRIESGKLTDHESMALTKYGVNPQTHHLTAPVATGVDNAHRIA